VKICIENGTNQQYAVKCIDGSKLHKEDVEGLKTELSLLRQLQHEHIIFFKDYFEDKAKNWHYVVTELLQGGELFTAIVAREKYTEVDARNTVATIADALGYCHARGVVHRDLKPENIMLDVDGPNAQIKIIDFGFATKIGTKDPMLHTACGTPGYVAPEIIPAKRNEQPQYGPGVDVWALGVITYILLCGYPPFTNDEQNEVELFRTIRRGEYFFYEEDWEHISPQAKDLIDSMLVVDAKQRFTIEQVKAHPWLQEATSSASTRDLSGAKTKLKQLMARRRLKKGIAAVVAGARMARLIGGLKFAAQNLPEDDDDAPGASAEDVKVET